MTRSREAFESTKTTEKKSASQDLSLQKEVAHLTKEVEKLKKSYTDLSEVKTGKRFLKTSVVKTLLSSVKEWAIMEVKEFAIYDNAMMEKTMMYDQTIRECCSVLRGTECIF